MQPVGCLHQQKWKLYAKPVPSVPVSLIGELAHDLTTKEGENLSTVFQVDMSDSYIISKAKLILENFYQI